MQESRQEIAVIIPVLNEDVIVEEALTKVDGILSANFNSYKIICIDDGSTDNTWEILKKQSEKNDNIVGVKLSKNFGHDAALFSGMQKVSADAYITMDCDGEHPFELIPEIYKKWRSSNCDVVNMVKGRRRKDGYLYGLGVKIANKIVGGDMGVDLANASEFKLLSHRARTTLISLKDAYVYYRALVPWIGLPQVDMTYDAVSAFRDSSRWSFSALVNFAVSGMVLFTNLPLRVMIWLGLLVFVICIFLGVKLFYSMVFGVVQDGYATLLLLVLINLSITMIGIGGLGIYISAILRQSLDRPRSIIEKTTDEK